MEGFVAGPFLLAKETGKLPPGLVTVSACLGFDGAAGFDSFRCNALEGDNGSLGFVQPVGTH